jgi:hypothetical protein
LVFIYYESTKRKLKTNIAPVSDFFFLTENTWNSPARVKVQDEVDILGDAGNADGTCDGISARS